MQASSPFMQRALQLARTAAGDVGANPLVGAVLVQGEHILAEGWHTRFGGPHAEVECLRAFGDGPVPEDAVMYVTLEPCSHVGKTPPCADLLIARDVKQVVIAHTDPFPEVSGRGIAKLRGAGVQVVVGMDEAEARWTNRRFLSSVERNRPYVVLKWARSSDGFLDRHPREGRTVQRISTAATDVLVHGWRSAEQAILVGGTTVLNDDPSLTVRHIQGPQPLRVVLDRSGVTPASSKVFDGSAPTLLFTKNIRKDLHVEQYTLSDGDEPLEAVLRELNDRGIRSLLVEGGAGLLRNFLTVGLWDEARVISGAPLFHAGTRAPDMESKIQRSFVSDKDLITYHLNPASAATGANEPLPAWPW
jgi:diaminohydroxyphosphoribosylaminopyrimidine deaminase/5-amino-6-(5-phosphoribosylamino)uracil reductase